MRSRPRPKLSRRQAVIAGIALLGIVAVALAVTVGRTRAAALLSPAGAEPLRASGIIRADKVNVASEFGGRVATMAVAEGDRVTAGQSLVRIDTALLDAQIEAGEAQVATAKAALDQVRAGSRPGQIAIAEAQLRQAQAARDAAAQSVCDLEALVVNPQDINLQIAVREAQLEAEEHRLAAAVARKDAAERTMDDSNAVKGEIESAQATGAGAPYGRLPASSAGTLGLLAGLAFRSAEQTTQMLDLSYIPYWQGWIGVNAQSDSIEGLKATLANLYAQQKNPQDLVAKLNQARAGLAQAEAQVAAAQAQVLVLRAGASCEQIGSLEARLGQAQAALQALHEQRTMRDIAAPVAGVVLDVVTREGEVAAQGAPLLTLADTRRLALTVYVPETQVGQAKVGQQVQITVDSFPGRVFAGAVRRIADSAQFTPRNVSTKEERVNLVFAVEIEIANEDGALKPGMPADVTFGY